MPARSSPSPSRISAMSAPTTKTSRPSTWPPRRARAASSCKPPSPQPSNYRATRHLDDWLKARGIIGLSGIDTRALTALIREKGMPNAVIAHDAVRQVRPRRAEERGARPGPASSAWTWCRRSPRGQRFTWDETDWVWGKGYRPADEAAIPRRRHRLRRQAQHPAPARRRRLQGDGGAGRRPRPRTSWR